MSLRYSVLLALACLAASAGVAHARGKLLTVEPFPASSACVQEPDGDTDQFWDVEAGKTYECTIIDVDDCANGGTDPTIGIRVNATGPGFIDLVATMQSTGVYKFMLTIPADNPSCTLPIHYCTPPGSSDPGLRVLRSCPDPCGDDDDEHPAHLRIATFGPSCSNPHFPNCSLTPARSRTWAQVKQMYR
jgi:hypothetical protein